MNDKTVTIYTLNGNVNYGNRLQLYALSRVLNSYGYDTYTYWKKDIKSSVRDSLKMLFPVKKKYRTEKKIKHFSDKYTPRTTHIQKGNIGIYGSDQIWNPNYISGNDYLLGLDNKGQKIAYAASLGIEELRSEHRLVFSRALNGFKAISVREATAKTALQPLTKKRIEIVLDPTLLISKEQYCFLEKKPKDIQLGEKYIVCYMLGDGEIKKKIADYAERNKYKIVEFSDKRDSCYGVEEFLYLIHHSRLVCTDSFHACVFSFIFERPFIAFRRAGREDYMYTRLRNLIDTFNLENREYCGKEITNENTEANYNEAKAILKRKQKESLEYLRNALGVIDEN